MRSGQTYVFHLLLQEWQVQTWENGSPVSMLLQAWLLVLPGLHGERIKIANWTLGLEQQEVPCCIPAFGWQPFDS